MLQNKSFPVISIAFLCFFCFFISEVSAQDRLFSPSVGEKFHERACFLASDPNIAPPERDQALIFLKATLTLDKTARYVLDDMIELACQDEETNQSDLVYQLLANYITESADLDVVRTAISYMRFSLQENPFDMETALTFAQSCESLQLYATAAGAYEYCANLYSYLYPGEPLPGWIYLPWALSNYNTQRDQHKCLQIASTVRESGRFDLPLEALAGKATEKAGDPNQAQEILRAAVERAKQLLVGSDSSQEQNLAITEQLAWFYCFVRPDADKAIDWANKVYSKQPDSTGAILAYALVMNDQTELAKTIIEASEESQISLLASAQIQLAEQQKDTAIATLKAVIDKDPGSLVAEKARQLLVREQGSYVPAVDPDILLTALQNSFGGRLVPSFTSPDEIMEVGLSARGSKFFYDSDFDGTLTIRNNSTEPLIISDEGLFTGYIRIDANITGDLTRQIPNIVSKKIAPSGPIEPDRSISVPVELINTELRQMLQSSPQGTLEIEYTVYLDPVTTQEGGIANRLSSLESVSLKITRSRVELSGKYLQNQLSSLSKGQQGQKIRAARLFAGLLKEQQQMADLDDPLYRLMYADWMPEILKSALESNLTDDDWVVKIHTMDAMVSLGLDYELTNAVAANLYDDHWPVRMMVVYVLAQSQDGGFGKVLDSKAQQDPHEFVRAMAIALGGTAGEKQGP